MYLRPGFWLAILAVEIVGAWFFLNAEVARGATPETAAAAGIAFLGSGPQLANVRWERISEQPGGNLGRSVRLVAYRGGSRVATATVNSFLWLGWQMRDYSIQSDKASFQ